MKLQLPEFLLRFAGDTYLHKYPFFTMYKPAHHRVKGFEIRQILNALQPGDIFLRRWAGYINTIFTPGYQGHAAMYMGDNTIVHAVGEGVIYEDILDFCRADSICLLRIKNVTENQIKTALNKATELEARRTGYDFKFQSGNGTVYCTELVDTVYEFIFKDCYILQYGNSVLLPDGIYTSPSVEIIIEFKH